jgi:hypothetical protein
MALTESVTIPPFKFWLIDSLLRHNPVTSKYRNEEEAEAAVNNGASAPEGGVFRDSRPSDATSSDVETGQSRTSWWKRAESRQESEVRSHLVGDVSDEEEEDDQSHSYPPPRSNSSSLSQLERSKKASTSVERVRNGEQAGEHVTRSSDEAAENGAATLASPPPSQKGESGEVSQKPQDDAAAIDEEDEDDAWNNWNEDKIEAPK